MIFIRILISIHCVNKIVHFHEVSWGISGSFTRFFRSFVMFHFLSVLWKFHVVSPRFLPQFPEHFAEA